MLNILVLEYPIEYLICILNAADAESFNYNLKIDINKRNGIFKIIIFVGILLK